MKKIGMVLLSGGKGTRLNDKLPKQFHLINGKPMIMYALEKVNNIEEISQIVICCPEEYLEYTEELVSKYNIKKDIKYVVGGKTRQESTYIGCKNLVDCDSVLIHESARPLVTIEDFRNIINNEAENITYAISSADTILKTDGTIITGDLKRSELVRIQLPQKFNYNKLMNAHEKALKEGKEFTEDSALFAQYNEDKIAIMDGSPANFKITTKEDYIYACSIFEDRQNRISKETESLILKNSKRTCVIVGASQGIGQATAIQLSKDKNIDNIALIARNKEKLEKTKSMLNKNVHSIIVPCDVTKPNEISKAADLIYNYFGSIDILVNGAGYVEPLPLFEMSDENINKTITTNLTSTLLLTKYFGLKMICDKKPVGYKKIINIASTAGSTPRPSWSAYASAKAGVIAFTSTMDQELFDYNIMSYCISPGRCATELRSKLAPDEDPTTIMQPEDVAEVISKIADPFETALSAQDIIVKQKTIRNNLMIRKRK